jgi:hypothetical protein
MVISEKIDGTNGTIALVALDSESKLSVAKESAEVLDILPGFGDGDTPLAILAGSRNRWLTEVNDNFGFAKWVMENAGELAQMGPGWFRGEWWGRGIQRGYDQTKRNFSLFIGAKPASLPECVNFVPTLYAGKFSECQVEQTLQDLQKYGSTASPGYMNPEGIVIYHTASGGMLKKTFEADELGKERTKAVFAEICYGAAA